MMRFGGYIAVGSFRCLGAALDATSGASRNRNIARYCACVEAKGYG